MGRLVPLLVVGVDADLIDEGRSIIVLV